ncbi:mannose-1-phosphate guanylyltransferase/mannose-6-phosphate isomerase [Acetobacter sp.]|uniref:mannose-1-phosphate guanylyltransferase/mannose-6-phosphate isomerase n=1 Tax=Acetobacter sp. TaxID=440 RepID=UPI0025C32EE6|nr:mannose-1-phosphate guanylyltransferase/mannose-6-phosphate isomerase [Acetobacter sp.]MCH4091343.1 mannose-1-phosphate guanylyltransferase/mannose-6-phosphate isomerase [Acetobacter sp.]MCI1299321.1 mannose-1-phosphate guanylyltransferase/mannose-6-phosphate isomerase [Acetobacter sp.]MCI1316675.1 mannose-1-phosphate guanylyltransferase/mannose-6-phosphate isomerase [Acetobacter sp.]
MSRTGIQMADKNASTVIPVILSGGSGTRLWPMSRASFPKQLWPLLSAQSLLQETALRARGVSLSAPVIVCNEEHRFLIAEQLREAGIESPRILLEPTGRNSAPAIAAAALLVAQTDPQAVLWLMAADAAITKPEALNAAMQNAIAGAERGLVVTFGMKPTRAETGYGYIEVGEAIPGLEGVSTVRAFREKPDAEQAEFFLQSGDYLWNSGMFVFRADTLIREMEEHAPDVMTAVRAAFEARKGDLFFERLGIEEFKTAPDISIDYAIAERSSNVAVVPADLGWSDVGSWDALWDISQKDAAGNVAVGDVLIEDSKNSYVRSEKYLTAVAGVDDLVVVTTDDAVLVTHRDRAQDVKKIVDRLKKTKRPEAASHNRCYRPWGFYESLIQNDRFQVKRIVVQPGEKLSLQKHFHRAEHWIVVGGVALVTRDEDRVLVRENESIYLPQGCVHRMENPGKIPLTLIEVQTGAYLGEDDIVRLEDTYNRS